MDYSDNHLNSGNNDIQSEIQTDVYSPETGLPVSRTNDTDAAVDGGPDCGDKVQEIKIPEARASEQSQQTAPEPPRATRRKPAVASTILGKLVTQADMDSPAVGSCPVGEFALFSRRSHAKLTPNEDAAVIIPIADRGVVLAVADGVGGLPQGEEAARVTLQTLVDYVTRTEDPSRLRVDIIDAIERANRRVLSLGGNAGTTLAVAQIIDHRVRTYHVGDSEIFVIGGRGAVKLQTLAHGPVAYGVHCGLIDPVEALMHEHRNLVSNIVGSHDMRIELGPPLKLAPRDLVVLCSDGITDNLHTEQIASTIRGKTPEVASKAILDTLHRMREPIGDFEFKEDDATFVIFRRPKMIREKQSVKILPGTTSDSSFSTQ